MYAGDEFYSDEVTSGPESDDEWVNPDEMCPDCDEHFDDCECEKEYPYDPMEDQHLDGYYWEDRISTLYE